MRRFIYLAAAFLVWGGMAAAQEEAPPENGAPGAQEENAGGAPAAEDGKEGAPKDGLQINIDPDLDKEFTAVELALLIGVAAAADEGKEADLESLTALGLSVAETDRQKAYVYLRISEMYFQRKDYQAAIDALKAGLPLAGEDRSKTSLYFRILRGLLIVYDTSGRIGEARPYIETYRQILSANVDPWERPAGTQDVIHKPSGIRLPQSLGPFTRDRLIVFDDTGRDAGAIYQGAEPPLPELSVYLVAEIGETAEAHFDGALRLILNRFAGAKVLSRGPIGVETEMGAVEGFAAHVDVPAQGYKMGLGSDLYVFVREGTLIKFRVSFRAQEREKMQAAMTDILQGFDWP